ncbi:MAG: ribonuclease III, partial [Actinomycetes bacterium]
MTADDAGADLHPLLAAMHVNVAPAMLELSLTHRSYAYENGGLP